MAGSLNAHDNHSVTIQQQKKQLLQLFSSLSAADRMTVLSFAEFLKGRREQETVAIPLPRPLPRPAEESVVAAIKRLSASYPMLDRTSMLNDTSTLMAQHVLQGRAASEVIDELEQVFYAKYERLKASSSEPGD